MEKCKNAPTYSLRQITDLQTEGLHAFNSLLMFSEYMLSEFDIEPECIAELKNRLYAMYDSYDELYELLFWNLTKKELDSFLFGDK